MNPLWAALLSDTISKTVNEVLKTYLARKDIEQVEKDRAEIRARDFIIASKDWLINAMLNPDEHIKLQALGHDLKLYDSHDTETSTNRSTLSGEGSK